MRVWALSTCETSRAALRALRAAGFAPVVTDIRADGLSATDIALILDGAGPAAVNRASATWRALPEAERARPAAELLAAHPLLLKRPAILHEGRLTLGWGPQVQAALLGAAPRP